MIDTRKYLEQGYSQEEINEAIKQMGQESELQRSYNRLKSEGQSPMSNTLVAGLANQDNLIKWQLELDSILERIEHILRGDRPKVHNGNLIFVEAKEESDMIFNDHGVAEIMRILSMYLNRNTILSNYDIDTIYWKVLDFGNEVSDLIFLKYFEMGLNTLDKRKRYPMIVHELIDTVHSAYLRALHGGERDSLRQARTISQSEQLTPIGPISVPGLRQKSLLNPMRLIKGKYY